jgi:hypothetical protein
MSPRTERSCPHENRPGIAVCLHCRHDARIAARERNARLATRGAFATLAVGILAAVGAAAASALQSGHVTSVTPEQPAPPARLASAPVTPPAAPLPPLKPLVAEGRTPLRDSAFALRLGNTVTVHFDVPSLRTRRYDKFERVVRTTLPAIFGPSADSLVSRFSAAALAQAGDLLTELPDRGYRVSLADGWKLALWPETRPGRDGPLVVAYRASVIR